MDETGVPDRSDLDRAEPASPADAGVDWTGVRPDRSPIRPLDDETFSIRLRLLGERAESLTRLREAFTDQSARGQQLP
jgi:hypothetical protein